MAIPKININDIVKGTEVVPLDRSISNILYGLNNTTNMPVLQSNEDLSGFTFFVRPQLNLHTINIRTIADYYELMNKDKLSADRYVRLLLDPSLAVDNKEPLYPNEYLTSPLVDNQNPFIPVLSNTLTTLTGWPDTTLNVYSSNAGLMKEQLSMVDSAYEIFDTGTLSASFRNFAGEPMTKLFKTWVTYMSHVFRGELNPYPAFLSEFERDSDSRIYRLVTDVSGRKVKRIAATGVCYPTTFPDGKFFDINREVPLTAQTSELNINFQRDGILYNTANLVYEFNMTVVQFNKSVGKYLDGDRSLMEEIPYDILNMLGFRGVPIIDMDSYEIKWLLNKDSDDWNRLQEIVAGSNDDDLDKTAKIVSEAKAADVNNKRSR